MDETIDPRFSKWLERYTDNGWDVEDAPIAQLDRIVRAINAMTKCVVGQPLFTSGIRSLCFPTGENNHAYHDAHSEVYKHLQDALSKATIMALGGKLGVMVKAGDKTTVTALEKIVPEALHAEIFDPLDVVSKGRRLADHNQRPEPESFPAFDTFGRDIAAVVRGLVALKNHLAERLDVDPATCERRAGAVDSMPTLVELHPVQPNYGIFQAFQIQGKQVSGVRAGYRKPKQGWHNSEALILEFSDGSMLSIAALTNVRQLIEDEKRIEPNALHVTFDVVYVPPMSRYATADTAEPSDD